MVQDMSICCGVSVLMCTYRIIVAYRVTREREKILGFLSPLLRTKRTNLVYTAVGLHMYIKQLLIDIGNKMAYLKCVKGITVLYEFIAALISFCYN